MTAFAVTWDYRCPFARNAHDHLVTALEAGAPWDVAFVPFSLNQPHIPDGHPSVWDDDGHREGRMAMEAALAVRELHPEAFLTVHRGLFDLRHVAGGDLRDRDQLEKVLVDAGVDAAEVFDAVEDGWPRERFREEHERAVREHEVWGVPTFIAGDQAVFVRLMEPADGDSQRATQTIERVVDLLTGFPELNEFKHTSLSH